MAYRLRWVMVSLVALACIGVVVMVGLQALAVETPGSGQPTASEPADPPATVDGDLVTTTIDRTDGTATTERQVRVGVESYAVLAGVGDEVADGPVTAVLDSSGATIVELTPRVESPKGPRSLAQTRPTNPALGDRQLIVVPVHSQDDTGPQALSDDYLKALPGRVHEATDWWNQIGQDAMQFSDVTIHEPIALPPTTRWCQSDSIFAVEKMLGITDIRSTKKIVSIVVDVDPYECDFSGFATGINENLIVAFPTRAELYAPVQAHELGHNLGLSHSSSAASLSDFFARCADTSATSYGKCGFVEYGDYQSVMGSSDVFGLPPIGALAEAGFPVRVATDHTEGTTSYTLGARGDYAGESLQGVAVPYENAGLSGKLWIENRQFGEIDRFGYPGTSEPGLRLVFVLDKSYLYPYGLVRSFTFGPELPAQGGIAIPLKSGDTWKDPTGLVTIRVLSEGAEATLEITTAPRAPQFVDDFDDADRVAATGGDLGDLGGLAYPAGSGNDGGLYLGECTLVASTVGYPMPTTTWSESLDNGSTWTEKGTGSSFECPDMPAWPQVALYRATIANPHGEITTKSVRAYSVDPAAIRMSPSPRDGLVVQGESFELSVVPESIDGPATSVRWLETNPMNTYWGLPLALDEPDTRWTRRTNPPDSWTYQAIVYYGRYGVLTDRMSVTALPEEYFLSRTIAANLVSLTAGDSLALRITDSGGLSEGTWRWQVRRAGAPSFADISECPEQDRCTIENISTNDDGATYRLLVSSQYESDVPSNEITIAVAPASTPTPTPTTSPSPTQEPFDQVTVSQGTTTPSAFSYVGQAVSQTWRVLSDGTATAIGVLPPRIPGGTLAACDRSTPADLPPGESFSCTYTFTASADDVASGTLHGTGRAPEPSLGQQCPVVAGASARSDLAGVSIRVASQSGSFRLLREGDSLTYDITVTNAGKAPVSGLQVVDWPGNGLRLATSNEKAGWTIDGRAALSPAITLSPGESRTIPLSVWAEPGALPKTANTTPEGYVRAENAVAIVGGATASDMTVSGNRACAEDSVRPALSDESVGIVLDNDVPGPVRQVERGATYSVRAHLTNGGTLATAQGAQYEITLPAGTEASAASGAGWRATGKQTVVTDRLVLGTGEELLLDIPVTVLPTAVGVLSSHAGSTDEPIVCGESDMAGSNCWYSTSNPVVIVQSPSPSPSASPSETPMPTPTPTETASPSPSSTPTETATPTPSPTPTETATPSPTPTPSETPTPTETPTETPTPTPTPTETASPSPSPSPSASPSGSATPTATPTQPAEQRAEIRRTFVGISPVVAAYPGQEVQAQYDVTNLGPDPASGVRVPGDDGQPMRCAKTQPFTLAVGEVVRCSQPHLVGWEEFYQGKIADSGGAPVPTVTLQCPVPAGTAARPDLADVRLSVQADTVTGELVGRWRSYDYVFTVTNLGSSAIANLQIADRLGAGLVLSESGQSLTWTPQSGLLVSEPLSLAAGESRTVRMRVTLDLDAARADAPRTSQGEFYLNNAASLVGAATSGDTTEAGIRGCSADAKRPRLSDASVSYQMTNDVPEPMRQVRPGDTYHVYLTATNTGPTSTAAGVTLAARAPSSTQVVGSSGIGWQLADGYIVTTPRDLKPGESFTVAVPVTVADSARGLLSGSVGLAGYGYLCQDGDLAGVNCTPSRDDPTVITDPGVSITKTNDQAPGSVVAVGTIVTYEFALTNHGPTDAKNLVIEDVLPPGLSFGDLANPDFTATDWRFCPPSSCWGPNARRTLDLAAGQSTTLTLRAMATSPNVAPTPNVATLNHTVAARCLQQPDAWGCAVDSRPLAIGEPGLSLSKRSSLGGYGHGAPGQVFSYEFTIANAGGQAATGLQVADALPAEIEMSPANQAGWTMKDGVVISDKVDAPALGTKTLTLSVRIKPTAQNHAWVRNSATLHGTGQIPACGDQGPAALCASDEGGIIIDSDDVFITKTNSLAGKNPRVFPGQSYEYQVVLHNRSDHAVEAQAEDQLPAGLELWPAAQAAWTVQSDGSYRSEQVTIPAQSEVAVPMSVRVKADASGELWNIASVVGMASASDCASRQPEAPGCAHEANPARVTEQTASISLANSLPAGTTSIPVGTAFDYVITVTNNGSQTLGAGEVSIRLPAGISFAPTTQAGWTFAGRDGAVRDLQIEPGTARLLQVQVEAVGPVGAQRAVASLTSFKHYSAVRLLASATGPTSSGVPMATCLAEPNQPGCASDEVTIVGEAPTPSASATPSPTSTPSSTATPSPTPTRSGTTVPSPSPSASQSSSPTPTPTPSAGTNGTPTPSATSSASPGASPSSPEATSLPTTPPASASPSAPMTPSPLASASANPNPTMSPTAWPGDGTGTALPVTGVKIVSRLAAVFVLLALGAGALWIRRRNAHARHEGGGF